MNAGCTMADMAEIEQVEDVLGGHHRRHRRGDPPRHLHELHRGPEGVRGPPRGSRLHVFERPRRPRMGVPAEAARALLPRPAPGAEHRLPNGHPPRGHARVGSLRGSRGLSTRRGSARARVVLWKGHCSVHNRFTPEMVDRRRDADPGREGDRPPGVPLRGGPEGGRDRLDGRDHQDDPGEPAGDEVGGGHRAEPGERLAREMAPGAARWSASTTASASAAPCSASTRPTCCGCWRAWSRASVRNPVRVPAAIARDARIALDRMLAIK